MVKLLFWIRAGLGSAVETRCVPRCVVESAADTRTKENPVMRFKYHIKPTILSSGIVAQQ